jgi:hypothetical protein
MLKNVIVLVLLAFLAKKFIRYYYLMGYWRSSEISDFHVGVCNHKFENISINSEDQKNVFLNNILGK